MIVKPSISFLNDDTDAKLALDVGSIVTAMTNNPNYTTPSPALADVTVANGQFNTAIENAVNGGTALTALKNERRAALVALMRQLASYVQVAANGNLPVLLSSGFPIQKPERQPVGVLPAPSKLTVTFGQRSGELRATAAPVPGAAIYNWQLKAATQPNVVLQSIQTTSARTTFTNLTPGVVYDTVVNVVGSAGPSDWTDPVSQMAV